MSNVTPTLAVEIRDTKPQPYVGKRVRAPLSGVGPEVQAEFGSLYAWLSKMAVAPAGPPFLIADTPKDGHLDIELGAPCVVPVKAGDGFEAGTLPGGRVAETVHHGAMTPSARSIRSSPNGSLRRVSPRWGPPREVYLSGPGEEPVTELVWPVR